MLSHPTKQAIWITGPKSSNALTSFIKTFRRQGQHFQYYYWPQLTRKLRSGPTLQLRTRKSSLALLRAFNRTDVPSEKYNLEKARAFANNLNPAHPLIIHRFITELFPQEALL